MTNETSDQFARVLGDAVVRTWSRLPHDIQQLIFEQAVSAHGEALRPQLAVFLHEKHSRTGTEVRDRAVPEPDSLGG